MQIRFVLNQYLLSNINKSDKFETKSDKFENENAELSQIRILDKFNQNKIDFNENNPENTSNENNSPDFSNILDKVLLKKIISDDISQDENKIIKIFNIHNNETHNSLISIPRNDLKTDNILNFPVVENSNDLSKKINYKTFHSTGLNKYISQNNAEQPLIEKSSSHQIRSSQGQYFSKVNFTMKHERKNSLIEETNKKYNKWRNLNLTYIY